MLAGIRDILIISTPNDIERFEQIFRNGQHLGLHIEYAVQTKPRGLADAFIVGESFIGNDDVCLILGDNILYGEGLIKFLENSRKQVERDKKSVVYGYYVDNPTAYGVVEFDGAYNVVGIEEKPQVPKSNYAVIGLYFYTNDVVQIAKQIQPSKRGEIEITSVNQEYLKRGQLHVQILGRGTAWLDAGSHETLIEAGNFIAIIEKRQGLKIACVEEIAYRNGFITKNDLSALATKYEKNTYGAYLKKIVQQ